MLKKEKSLEKSQVINKLIEIIPKKIKINEKEIDLIGKALIERGFLEYDSEKQIYIYIP